MNIELFIAEDINTEQYKRIDLFDDENIFYRGKIIDSQDLNALFNDLVNTFAIPSTPKTDNIFKYWFEIGVNNGFNINKRVPAYIQVNSVPLKFGELQLEEVIEKDGKVDNYKVTMYGKLTGLDEIFGEDNLSDLDLSEFNFGYTKNNLQAGISFPALIQLADGFNENSDIVFPFILPTDKEVQYNTGNTDDITDISQVAGRLSVKDFRPGIRQIRLIEAIERKYNITFSRDFLNTASFKNSYMWLNGQEDFKNLLKYELIELINNPDPSSSPLNDGTFNNDGSITLTRDFNNVSTPLDIGSIYSYVANMEINISNISDPNLIYTLRIVDNDSNEVIREFVNITGNNNLTYLDRLTIIVDNTLPSFTNTYRIEISTQGNLDFNLVFGIRTELQTPTTIEEIITNYISNTSSQSFNGGFDVSNNLPEMEVGNYIKSLIKQFKLVIRPESENSFFVDNIVDYFNKGNLLNFTNYVDYEENIPSSRYKTYRKINFNFKEPETAPQNEFKSSTGRFRGNSIKRYDVDNKNELSVSIDFEIPSFVRLRNSQQTESTLINLALLQGAEATAEWTDNPCMFYYNGVTKISNEPNPAPIVFDYLTENFEVNGNPDTFTATTITLCDNSDSEIYSQVNNTLDYADTTINGWHGQPIQNNLYNNYYKPWLDLIYDPNTRLKRFICKNVPFSIITELELNTTIIVDNNKYNIEEFEINLLTGDIELVLFPTDFNVYSLQPLDNKSENIYFNAGGNWDSINVESNETINISFRDSTWLKGDRDTIEGLPAGRYTISFYAAYNPSTSPRSEIITVTSGNRAKVLFINQRTV